MKRKLILLLSFFMGIAPLANVDVLAQPVEVELQVCFEDPKVNQPSEPRSPILIPSVGLDGYTLLFYTPCDGCTLRVVSCDEVVEYTTVIPAGATSLTLPSYLSGNYELQIIRGNFCFYGDISL